MKKTTKVVFWSLALVALTTLSSATATPKAAADDRRPLIAALSDFYTVWDPHVSWWSDDIDIATLLAEPLYQIDITNPKYLMVPRLAADFPEWAADKMSMLVQLREDIKFHDGTDFNASAVVWNIDRILALYEADLSQWGSGLLNNTALGVNGTCRISGASVVSEYLVNITLSAPFVPIINVMSFNGFVMLSPTAHADFAETAFTAEDNVYVGTGPFVFAGLTSDDMTFLANENYWRAPPDIKKMVWVINDDDTSRSEGLIAGDYDQAGILPSFYDQAEASPLVFFDEGPLQFVQFWIALNNHLYNLNERKAMAYAFNYTHFQEKINLGKGALMKSPLPSGIEYGRDDYNYPTTDYLIARTTILAEYGATAGLSAADAVDDPDWVTFAETTPFFNINFTYYGPSTTWQQVAALLVDNMKKIGVNATGNGVTDTELDDMLSKSENHDKFGMAIIGWGPDYLEASNQIAPMYKTGGDFNYMQYSDVEVDTLLANSETETNQEIRKANFERIQEILIEEDFPCIFLLRRKSFEIHSIYLTNWYANPMTDVQTYYHAHWNPPAIELPPVDKPSIPGFVPAFLVAAMGVTALLLMKKIKK
jgi:peptide/nickel transport system substrate-binding protein